MNTKFIVWILLFSSYLSCNFQQSQTIDLLEIENTEIEQIVGTYFYSYLYFSSKIELREDSIFKMTNNSCLGESVAEGNWKIDSSSILILNSFELHSTKEQIPSSNNSYSDNIKTDTINDNIEFIITVSAEGDVYPSIIDVRNQKFSMKSNELLSLEDSIVYIK